MAKPRDAKGSVDSKSRSVTSDLAKRIAKAQNSRPGAGNNSSNGSQDHGTGHGRAVRLGSEFIAAILVGTGMGYLLDLWLGTGPWLMLGMLLVGFGAGVVNVTRSVAEMNAENPAPLDADLGPGDEEDDEY